MKQRSLLKSQIIEAWHRCITKDYHSQSINSERSLQASFWSQINSILSKNRRMFIEPGLIIEEGGKTKKVIPDLVICNTKEVIGIVELKYLPRGKPKYEKDIATLSSIAKFRKSISISNERFRGPTIDEKVYGFSKNILFVWAGVHAKINNENALLYSTGHSELNGCFFELHAETNTNSFPKIYERS